MACCCRDSHKGSERPGLGLETAEVSVYSATGCLSYGSWGSLNSSTLSLLFLTKAEEKGTRCLESCHVQAGGSEGHVCTFQWARLTVKWMNTKEFEYTNTQPAVWCVVCWQLIPGFTLWTDTKFLEKLFVTDPLFCVYGDVCLCKIIFFYFLAAKCTLCLIIF